MGQLTGVQERTLRELIGGGRARSQGGALARGARSRLEEGLGNVGLEALFEPLWLGKGALTDVERCQGLFEARLRREGPAFSHSERSAAGALFHKAVEVDVGSRQRSTCTPWVKGP